MVRTTRFKRAHGSTSFPIMERICSAAEAIDSIGATICS